jgi:periplasmic protein TonB
MSPVESLNEPVVVLPLAPPVPLAAGVYVRGRGSFSAAVLIAALAHGTALAGLLVALDSPFGYGGLERNAIDVSLVDASALERPAVEQDAVANGAGVDSSAAAAAIETASIPAKQPHADIQPDTKAQLREEIVPPDAAPIVVARETSVEPVEKIEATEKPAKPETADQTAAVATQSSEAASPAPSVTVAPITGSAPAAAPPGVAKDYARSVVKAISSSKPSGNGVNGVVYIAFSISTAGRLDDVRITKSSGIAKLDQTAIATVRRARFIPPPPGMTSQQLVYEMPFNFR